MTERRRKNKLTMALLFFLLMFFLLFRVGNVVSASPQDSLSSTQVSEASSESVQPEVPSVNPYGPTVSDPATLTNVGLPEYEIFYNSSQDGPDFKRSQKTPILIKYTFNPRWMLSLNSDGFLKKLNDNGTVSGFGDPSLAIKYLTIPPAPNHSAQAFQFSWKIPTGDPSTGLSTGFPDYTFTWFYSRDFKDVHMDFNFFATNLCDSDGTRRIQLNESLAFTIPITKRLSYSAEVYHFGWGGESNPPITSTMHALSYSVSPALNISAGIDMGLSKAAPIRTYIFGVVFYIGGAGAPKPLKPVQPSMPLPGSR